MKSDIDQSSPSGAMITAMLTLQFTAALLLTILVMLAAPAQAVQFRNFSSMVTLAPLPDGFFSLAGVKVKTTGRIVVKAAPGVVKKALHSVDTRVTEVTELYLLDSGSYFAISFADPGDLEQILARFTSSPLVLTAQPDLLQIHDKSGRGATRREPTAYIKKLGIEALWENTRGKGVKVAIIDDGFDLNHEDLRGVASTFAYDLESGTLDPSPRVPLDTHGTEVAGIIFARHNGIGIDGIAPEADFIAIRHPDTWTSRTILSFYLAKMAGADIINCSWKSRFLLEPIADIINDLTTKGRHGKGVALVFAAGNEGGALADRGSEAALPEVITVGAAGANGRPLKFSNFGKEVDVYTFGQDILTTSNGTEKYSLFSGTSASAAIISGTIALFLSQAPDLNLTDIHQKIVSFFQPR
jgi:subtilisin family serine protease